MSPRIILSWGCYWAGDLVSRVMGVWPTERWHPYFVYHHLMNWSDDLQGDDPRGPWSPPAPELD